MNELALEISIEKVLSNPPPEGHGFFVGDPQDFKANLALDEKLFLQFLEKSQETELTKIKKVSDWKGKLFYQFEKISKKYGILHILRKGLSFEDAHFTLFYQLPMDSSSEAVKENFKRNIFSVTRQVHYNTANPNQSIDMVLFVNGLPIATLELKNPWTGQTAKVHAIKQYKTERDPEQPLLQFGRCLVHFAVDTDEVYMTTRLAKENTFFLPFNRGNNQGKGNPVNPNGHKTAYLWEEVFSKESLAGILQHFVRMDGSSSDPLTKRNLYFPRYHQLDVVRNVIAHAREKGVGQKYLIQHSAGSGKSNSITWLAYQLIEVYPKDLSVIGARGKDAPLFDSVIVVTDRTLLDKQIRENIKNFSEVKNIIAPAYSSSELKKSLEEGKRIIITTIQKFQFIIDGIDDLSEKRFAVIIDEAHSSQGGVAAAKMNQAMGNLSENEEEEEDIQDKILRIMSARKMKGNASYFAFTATPKNTTLEKFGTQTSDGKFHPFHLYSMKQAIEEGFIHDVLRNYTTFRSYYELKKSVEENPLFERTKAQKKLRSFVERHQRTIDTKSEVIIDHFISQVYATKKLKGKAKGLVVTQNIESAIRYYLTLKKLLDARGNPFKILIAFSGKKKVDGIEYTEEEMNGIPEKDTRIYFDKDEYRLLVVANKYLTGFDQPKLCTMYIDKKLQGVLAVQALSRLNRSADSLGKKTEDLFILDFFNSVDDIKESFDPFYTSTSLSGPTNVNVLHELQIELDESEIYYQEEVELFSEKFFSNVESEKLSPIVDKAASRFNEELGLEYEDKADLKIKAKQFVKVYGQVSSIISFDHPKWEKLFWFLKFLIPKMVVRNPDDDLLDELLNSVDLSTYGLERTRVNVNIGLDDSPSELEATNSNPRGFYGGIEEEDRLDVIIRSFNERWFQGWNATPEDQRFKFVTLSKDIQDHPDFNDKVKNNQDHQNRDLAFAKILDEVMSKRRKQEMELYKLYAQDDAFKQAFFQAMKTLADQKKAV